MSTGILKVLAIVTLCFASPANYSCEYPAGTVVGVSINISKHGELTGSRVLVGDQVVSEKTFSVKMSMQQQIEYRDHCLEEKSKLRGVEREFLRVRSQYKEVYGKSVANSDIEESETSILEGVRLAFDWDPELEKYKVVVRGKGAVRDFPQLQETVKPSFSATFLNPSNASPSNGQWKLPTDALRDLLLAPGGDLFAFVAGATSPGKRFVISQQKAYLESMVGEIQATIIPLEAGQTSNQIRISIAGEASSAFSVPFAEESMGTRSAKESVKLSGVAIWDEDKDRLESISLDAVGHRHNIDDITVASPSGRVDGKLNGTVTLKNHWELRCTYESAAEAK